MITTLIAIGNSRGVRIPKVLLKESGLENEIEIKAKKGEIKITPVRKKSYIDPLAAASNASLAKDWLRPEEEKAWKAYQSDK